jgi:hypothetical protein
MDPDRIRAYLQVACAGLGFDIGEIWWTSSDTGSSALAAIGEFIVKDNNFFSCCCVLFALRLERKEYLWLVNSCRNSCESSF